MSGGGGSFFQMPAVAENEEGPGQLFLPPGFRFHPRDDEVIEDYLAVKIENPNFTTIAMGDVDLNKCEPWELPRMAKMGEKEWYFFCQKDMKYPTGTRANRATKHGYWKATGKDKEIYSIKTVGSMKKKVFVGMKKTLVFYTGRAPKGVKTNWVMHEFRLEGTSKDSAGAKITERDEWVVCRVNEKKNSIVHKGSQLAEADPSGPVQAAESDPSSSLHETAGTDLSSSYNTVNGASTTSYQAVKMDPLSSFDEQDVFNLYGNPNFCYENDMSISRFATNFATSSTAMNMPDHFSNFSGIPGTMTQPNTVLFTPNNYSSSNQFGANQSLNGNLGYKTYDTFRIRGQGATNSSYVPMNNFNSYQ